MTAKKKAQDDDDWEPDDADLFRQLEDLGDIDAEPFTDDDIDEDEVVVVGDDLEDNRVSMTDEEEDDDDDEIDDDVDIWQEDDEEEEEEEEVDEEVDIEEEEDTRVRLRSKAVKINGEPDEWDDDDEGEQAQIYLEGETDQDDEDEWDEEEVDADYPLEDDEEDPDYMAQKKLLEEDVTRREQVAADNAFDEVDYFLNQLTDEQAAALDKHPLTRKVEAIAKDIIEVDEVEVESMDLEKAMENTPDLMDDDPYENKGETNIFGTGVTDDDLQQLDEAWKNVSKVTSDEIWDKVYLKAETTDWDNLPNQTLDEMEACLEEIGGSAYNVTRWLLYDLDFNVSNLILAAVKHNREAPILFQHWFPQLLTYERYQHARDRDFNFNWQDVEAADISELERYYAGFGYEEIPKKAPAETGIISLEELDEEELKMAAFESWMTSVYNPEWDRKDFDDDDMQDEDNVFSEFYQAPQHPDLPTWEDTQEDLAQWEEEFEDEDDQREYREMMGRNFKFTLKNDEEFEREFRGHLVVACGPFDEDLEIAEKITAQMEKNFGKQVYVETRVIAHVRDEDNVFEVWLESYDIDLLHSKKRASSNAKDWFGPAECDDKQIEYLVESVGTLISDDARYSYRRDVDLPV